MCNPAAIAGGTEAAISVGTAVLGHIATNQAYAANKTAANYNYANRSNIIEQQRVQLDQARSENALDTSIARLKAEGEVAASASDLGAGSSSVVSSINAAMFGLGRQAGVESEADQAQRIQIGNEKTGAAIARTSQINSMPKSSPLALALGIGKGLLQGAQAFQGAGGKF